jgi:glycosyltransferase involved in cell wall biosynthesis
MRVAVNALFLQEPHTGTGRYVYNLLQSLGRVDGVTEYVLLSPHELVNHPETPSSFRWEVVPVGTPSRGGEHVEKLWWEQRTFPLAAKRMDASVIHVPYFAPPLRTYQIPVIVTIHDVINLRLPAYRASPAIQAYSRLVTRSAHNAAMIVTVSEFSKFDIIETLGIPEDRIRVIREAPASAYRPVSDPERIREVREKYGLGERFVLNVGGMDQRKNIAGLVGAFAAVYHELNDRSLQLFIAGDPSRLGTSMLFPDWRPHAASFGIADQIVCAPVDEEDLPVLYSATECFAFASLYEGFGLTPLEAMACGAPVVSSDRTSLPEVIGNAGILVDPDDTDRFGAALRRVLTSPKLREDLRMRGLARVKLFGWDQVAVDTAALYTEVSGTTRD